MKILVTGCAGFIGMHTAIRLLEQGDTVVGIDNLNDYYDPALKIARLDEIQNFIKFTFQKIDLADRQGLEELFSKEKFDRVVHLAAQAGVRYSITNPHAYGESNLIGFLNILECCRHNRIEHLVYASSSSVYGGNTKMPFAESDPVDHPVSLYAATKKANELMAHTYSHLYGLPTTGLRFFTVYGPWGRPDMAYYSFAKNIIENKPIKIFNHGKMMRDFTYIDDIVQGIVSCLCKIANTDAMPNQKSERTKSPYKIFNIGNNSPIELGRFIEILEDTIGKKAIKDYQPMQPGDVVATYANIDSISSWVKFSSKTNIEEGLFNFISWYKTRASK